VHNFNTKLTVKFNSTDVKSVEIKTKNVEKRLKGAKNNNGCNR